MSIDKEVTFDQLKINYDFKTVLEKSHGYSKLFPGNTDLQNMLETILKLGNNQHIYISNNKGSKAEEFLIELLSQKENKSYEWGYVYNFQQPNFPMLIKLENGQGDLFKEMVEGSVITTFEESKKCFSSKEIKDVEKDMKAQILEISEKELEVLKNDAKELGFSTHVSDKGIFFIPIINGKKISETEYDNLDAKEQEVIIKDLDIMEKKSIDVMKKIKKLKKDSKKKIKAYKEEIITQVVEKNFDELKSLDWKYVPISNYIDDVKKDLEEQLKKIFLKINRQEVEKYSELIQLEKIEKENKYKYLVNLLVNPQRVIYANKITYYELFGKIEYINDSGVFVTDFTHIQSGLMQRANGGYIILDINDVIGSKLIWDKIKKTLIEKTIEFDPIREQLGALPVRTIIPEKMPLDVKVILIGEESIYNILAEYDTEFKAIFPYHLIVPDEVEANEENISAYIAYLKNKELTDLAKKRIIDYCIRYTGNKSKLTTKLTQVDKLISIGEFFAKEDCEKYIKEKHIKKGEEELIKHYNYYIKMLEEWITSNQLILDVTGKKVGQINGLSVNRFVDFQIAFPIRITAGIHAGEQGVVSIEKENKLSGKIFGKGLSIITSYINSIFAKEKPLSFCCSICFEQVYGEIEGDSASCAEIYTVLSALSNISINQGIAITGSVDQFGNVQPIGAVSNKIEGYYNVCKLKGLTGKQGVIVPNKNIQDIVLSDELMQVIQRQKFHIFGIDKIEEGVPILMNTTFKRVKKVASVFVNQMQA
ncbi:MAG: hypothetical protein CVU84_16305 [Firmicutes bacterium HGW-Firmicutes-1]|jgi:predicted ATP-dependent protease|nr:MAG: hypothetical protein CVU84_16305 [Firmicutes bacterium HGW-Firmicutes-1]